MIRDRLVDKEKMKQLGIKSDRLAEVLAVTELACNAVYFEGLVLVRGGDSGESSAGGETQNIVVMPAKERMKKQVTTKKEQNHTHKRKKDSGGKKKRRTGCWGGYRPALSFAMHHLSRGSSWALGGCPDETRRTKPNWTCT